MFTNTDYYYLRSKKFIFREYDVIEDLIINNDIVGIKWLFLSSKIDMVYDIYYGIYIAKHINFYIYKYLLLKITFTNEDYLYYYTVCNDKNNIKKYLNRSLISIYRALTRAVEDKNIEIVKLFLDHNKVDSISYCLQCIKMDNSAIFELLLQNCNYKKYHIYLRHIAEKYDKKYLEILNKYELNNYILPPSLFYYN